MTLTHFDFSAKRLDRILEHAELRLHASKHYAWRFGAQEKTPISHFRRDAAAFRRQFAALAWHAPVLAGLFAADAAHPRPLCLYIVLPQCFTVVAN